MNKLFRLLAFFTLLFVFSSCQRRIFNFSFFEKEKVEVQNLDFDLLQIKSQVRFHNGEKVQKANANIRIKDDSIVWVSISYLGVEAVRAKFEKDSIRILKKLDKKYHVLDYKTLSEKSGIDLSYNILQNMLTGNLLFKTKWNDKLVRKEEHFELLQRHNKLFIKNLVDPMSLKVEKVVVKEDNAKHTLSICYSDFNFIDKKAKKKRNIFFPFKSTYDLIYYKGDQVISNKIDFKVNKVEKAKKLRFPFKIPRKYVRQ
ncbi:MAG: DUF4292 domain-containing protein [Cytophagales bacterium]|nr:DUF4292 domain-containing protein [Cytophagales bacterium]